MWCFVTCTACYSSCTFNLQCDGHDIKWSYIKDLYMLNAGKSIETPGLCIVPKLKLEHIKFTSFLKMRVDLAAQLRYLFVQNNNYIYHHLLLDVEQYCSKGY